MCVGSTAAPAPSEATAVGVGWGPCGERTMGLCRKVRSPCARTWASPANSCSTSVRRVGSSGQAASRSACCWAAGRSAAWLNRAHRRARRSSVTGCTLYPYREPGPHLPPFALYGADRPVDDACRLLQSQPRVITEQHQLRQARLLGL